MDTPELLADEKDGVLTVTFNRPDQRNAMTWRMYDDLHAACERADADDGIRVMVLRGAGEKAFVAGTDISQFATFTDGADGVTYEQKITRIVNRLEDVDVPTVAAVRGFCVGGGLAIAAACDLRIATPAARFGVPIARTLGNCLSMNTYSLLLHHLGPAITLDLLLRARLLTGAEAAATGFVAEVCADDELDGVVADVVDRLLGHSPLSMWAAKEAVRRMRRATIPDGDDIVAQVFASGDFHRAVEAFTERRPVRWEGR